jgi:uncharacterized protein
VQKGSTVGNPVIHFEVTGKDGANLAHYYSDLFGWQIDADNPLHYGVVQRDGNTTSQGVGIGGGVGAAPDGSDGLVTFYVEVPDIVLGVHGGRLLGDTLSGGQSRHR